MQKEDLVSPDFPPEGEWTAAEQLELRRRLLPLLVRRTELYTAGDSSVRVETAQELLSSICCTLDEGLSGAPRETLLTADLEAVFTRGGQVLDRKAAACRELWSAACLTVPKLESRSLMETLRDLGLFWRRYDARFFAHRFPCDIDYPLLLPVSETLSGVSYLEAYLRGILAENALLAAFDAALLSRVLDTDCPIWRDAPVNLVSPVLANAVGRSLVGKDPRGLALAETDLSALAARFCGLSEEAAGKILCTAAEKVCDMAGICDGASRAYFAAAAAELLPRLQSVPVRGWRGIFPLPR